MAAELHLYFTQSGRTYIAPARTIVVGLAGSCDLCLGDYLTAGDLRVISRRHFRITHHKADGFAVEDLDSMNGTWVNDQPLRPGAERFLRSGDIILPAGNPAFRIEVRMNEDDSTVVITRRAFAPPLGAVGLRYATDADQFTLDGQPVPHTHLTALEHALLRHLVRNAGRVCTYDDLIENVWGYARYDETQNNTVAKTVSNLRKKLNDLSPEAGNRYIHTVHGRGVEYIAGDPRGSS
jgi:hypothetical protein